MAAATEDFSRDGSKQQGEFRAKLQVLNNTNCSSSGSSGDAMIIHASAGHATLQSCFPSAESPATPDSPTDSHLSMDPPATFTEQVRSAA